MSGKVFMLIGRERRKKKADGVRLYSNKKNSTPSANEQIISQ
jgi:hypothetical protein